MKVSSEDILKPGAVLRVERIEDREDYEEIKSWLAETRRRQKAIRKTMRQTQAHYDNLRKVITI